MERKTTYTYDEMGNLLTMTDPKLRVTTYTYDLEGNLTTLTSPMGREERYVYDAGGRRIQRLTPSGNVIIYDYDTLNALADKLYQDGNEEESDYPVRMGYNAMGQRVSMEDITGASSYTYDGLGRLKTATNGSGKTVTYEYDEADNLSCTLFAPMIFHNSRKKEVVSHRVYEPIYLIHGILFRVQSKNDNTGGCGASWEQKNITKTFPILNGLHT